MLDPNLHTPAYLKSRSALLTTTVLAVASTVLANLSLSQVEQAAEAFRLQGHAEKLSLVVFASGARSVEIVQAQILLCRWGPCPKTRLDEQRWMRAAMYQRMATEIGLDHPRRHEGSTQLDVELNGRLRRNDLRTRIFLVLNEYR